MDIEQAKETLRTLPTEIARLDKLSAALQVPADDATALRAEIAAIEAGDAARYEEWIQASLADANVGPVSQPADTTKLRARLATADHQATMAENARASIQGRVNALAQQGELAGAMIRTSARAAIVAQANDLVSEIERIIQGLGDKLVMVVGARQYLSEVSGSLAFRDPASPERLALTRSIAALQQLPPALAGLVPIEKRDVETATIAWSRIADAAFAEAFAPETAAAAAE
jgi:hypothetical protein